MPYNAYLDKKLLSAIKTINEIISKDIESCWSKFLDRVRSKLLIAFLVDVTSFPGLFKKLFFQKIVRFQNKHFHFMIAFMHFMKFFYVIL